MASGQLTGRPLGHHVVEQLPPATWTTVDRDVGRWACRAVFLLSLAYIPAMLAGFLANGGLSDPVQDPYLAVMELLILPLAIALVLVFAAVLPTRPLRGPR